MLLAIDVGNTNLCFGIYDGWEMKGSFRLKTDPDRTSDEIGLFACDYFRRFGLDPEEVEDVIIASVVPMLLSDTIAAQSALGLFWMAMLVIGMILLVRGRKQQVWLHGPCAPSLKAVLQNAGMFLLIVACFVQTVFNYL